MKKKQSKPVRLVPQTKVIANQPSWIIRNDEVELAITQLGAHMAPVTFYRKGRAVQPYYVSPWQEENLKINVPVLAPLRGDFFCAPFGGNGKTYHGEKHPCHGETSGARWRFQQLARQNCVQTLTLSMKTKTRCGQITKKLSLVDGHNVIYSQHILEGFSGVMPLGHHPTLAVPQEEGSMRVSTSRFDFGMTCPLLFSDPANREYQSLAIGETFKSLRRVPSLWKTPAYVDCTAFPARKGFTDLLGTFHLQRAGSIKQRIAWTIATVAKEGYLWFSLKDPQVLPSTLFWISNQGRHAAPWNGRNRCLGLEDTCSFFAEGLAQSAGSNILNKKGIATVVELSPDRPFAVNYIQGVVKVPRNFQVVHKVQFHPEGLRVIAPDGQQISTRVYHEFIQTGRLSPGD